MSWRAFGASLAVAIAACGPTHRTNPGGEYPEVPPAASNQQQEQPPATVEGAQAFVDQVNKDLKELWGQAERAAWVKSTYITHDTQKLEAREHERVMEYMAKKIKEARRFENLELPADTKRALYLLKYAAGLPAPDDVEKRKRLAELSTELDSIYATGKACSPKFKGHGRDKANECLALGELTKILADSRDYDLLLEVWKEWRKISRPMRGKYKNFVSLGNEGARELGFADMSQIWKGGYDMSAGDFEKEMDRLWTEVKPLYEKLHCYVRAKLQKKYGEKKVGKRIPAHLLGNMWAQDWANLYSMMEPYPGQAQLDLTPVLKAKKYDAKKMVELGEGFFKSLGMQPLPKTFWERSLFVKPQDREVVCHASAWDVGMSGDLRIKMCIKINHEDLVTIHHELGHNYYFMYYNHLPALFQAGANDGFHEGIGDTLALSATPAYFAQLGLIKKAPNNEKADLNLLMQRALEGVAFLPFGKLIDEWRWNVFNGKTSSEKYNAAWWDLRRKYQGIEPPVLRTETDFDPGAKYHIPANTPYTRYFIARILQYQFLRALCKEAGHEGPLYRCSIYGNKAAGKKMMAMLRLGASKPWAEALRVISGETRMDATALLDYYRPLSAWLDKQNEGQSCGWN